MDQYGLMLHYSIRINHQENLVNMNKSDVIDPDLALEQAGGNEELAKELLGMLLAELPKLRDMLGTAIKEKNLQAMWDHAHKIYGSTAYCGVPGLRAAAQALEAAIKIKDFPKVASEFELTRSEIERILEVGNTLLQKNWV